MLCCLNLILATRLENADLDYDTCSLADRLTFRSPLPPKDKSGLVNSWDNYAECLGLRGWLITVPCIRSIRVSIRLRIGPLEKLNYGTRELKFGKKSQRLQRQCHVLLFLRF